MFVPLRRVRYSIDVLQKNMYDYHHGPVNSTPNNSMRRLSPRKVHASRRRCQRIIQFIEDSFAIIQAIFVRLIFILSTLVAVWRLVEETHQKSYWYLLLLLIFLLLETYITVYTRKGYEYKWFCPSAFTYLIAIVPCIWLLELHESHQEILLGNQTQLSSAASNLRRFAAVRTTSTTTTTTAAMSLSYEIDRSDSKETENDELIRIKRASLIVHTDNLSFEELLKTPQEFIFILNQRLTLDQWNMIIEQMSLLILILSRWLLPKGELTREELSQLLLVYIGIAADIIEFFEVFKEPEVRKNISLCILILSLWTLSLLQFCLAFTISHGRKSRLIIKEDRTSFCNPSDFWGMLMSLFLQDIPFFSFRVVLILRYQILSYSTVFFTAKNGLIIILECYRMTVILAATISQQRSYQPRRLIRILGTNTHRKISKKSEV